jgi:hypothetical protein
MTNMDEDIVHCIISLCKIWYVGVSFYVLLKRENLIASI